MGLPPACAFSRPTLKAFRDRWASGPGGGFEVTATLPAALPPHPPRAFSQLAAARRARPSTKMSMSISKRSSASANANSPARLTMLGKSSAGSDAM